MTAGIVSALHREMTRRTTSRSPTRSRPTRPINHGNSGGPLLDLAGQVIGINTQIKSDSGENTGVGFAMPSDTVQSIVSQLLTSGNVKHAYLGVGIATAQNGVQLNEVRPGTPAEKAGLQIGDVIMLVDGQKVTNAPSSLRRSTPSARARRSASPTTATAPPTRRPSRSPSGPPRPVLTSCGSGVPRRPLRVGVGA